MDYVQEEHKRKERIIFANDHFTALVPYWAVWPFEVLVTAHRPSASLKELSSTETSALADVFKQVTTRYDNLFEISFPYSMGFHQAPPMDSRTLNGSCTRIFIRRYCAQQPSANSWLATKCSPCRSVTLRQKLRQNDCARFQMYITNKGNNSPYKIFLIFEYVALLRESWLVRKVSK